ncbi:peptidase M50 [Nanobdella aerobiophila]|uniref:Peptidase M50 n=1 Tax=Nanobdella aerobiophila TaxID=2586965 RepID=A0A915SAK0_9ARCH|nr:site-2 protease family protein [Nanobdella aerobiophila]BBL45817.1 peptidase M50 [Nanobdella aerobiophila]
MNYQLSLSGSTELDILILFFVVNIIFIVLKILFRKNVDYKFIYGMVKTEKYTYIMESLSKGLYAKILSISSLIISPILIFSSLIFLIFGLVTRTPTYAPVIPGASYGPITLPLAQTIISIFIAAFIHELSHGVLSFRNKIKIKDWGFFYLGPLLGAFVDPNEEEINKTSKKEQLKIYGAGATINIIAGFIFLFILLIFNQLTTTFNLAKPYVSIVSTIPGTYAYGVIPNDSILYSINNYNISYLNQIQEVLNKYSPGQNVTIYTNKGTYDIELVDKYNETFLGVYVEQEYNYASNIIPFTGSLLLWLFIINLGLGIGNMIPIYPLDGGRALKALLEAKFEEKKAKKIMNIISIIIVILILYNISFLF